MAFFGFASQLLPAIRVEGADVWLRPPEIADFPAWSHLREESRAFLVPWEPVWPSDDLTRAGFKRRLRRYAADMRADQAYPFLLFRAAENALVGGVTLANVRRGISQTGTLGYWIGARFARQGLMTAALRVLIPYLFHELRLHRLEAACLPTNASSIRLLERCGFEREGYARSYLCINGAWEDHVLYARLKDEAGPAANAGREVDLGLQGSRLV